MRGCPFTSGHQSSTPQCITPGKRVLAMRRILPGTQPAWRTMFIWFVPPYYGSISLQAFYLLIIVRCRSGSAGLERRSEEGAVRQFEATVQGFRGLRLILMLAILLYGCAGEKTLVTH